MKRLFGELDQKLVSVYGWLVLVVCGGINIKERFVLGRSVDQDLYRKRQNSVTIESDAVMILPAV
jgi:hypothetical protein